MVTAIGTREFPRRITDDAPFVGLAHTLKPAAPARVRPCVGGRGNGGFVGDPRQDTPDRDPDERDRGDDTPETPPTEPAPVPIEDPPSGPGQDGPYVVGR
jgi:hypothetical protein